MNLIGEYNSALQNCENDLIKMSNERQYRGMEKVYHAALMEVLENNPKFNEIRREAPLEDIGGRVVDDRSRGRVDIVIVGKNSNVHAVELKIVQLPREKNLSPNQSLYDIGQITGDFLRLKGAKKLTSFDCVIVLHGVLLSVYGTPKSLLREFHNRMFVDFKTSELGGELKTEKKSPASKETKPIDKAAGSRSTVHSIDKVNACSNSRKIGIDNHSWTACVNLPRQGGMKFDPADNPPSVGTARLPPVLTFERRSRDARPQAVEFARYSKNVLRWA